MVAPERLNQFKISDVKVRSHVGTCCMMQLKPYEEKDMVYLLSIENPCGAKPLNLH